MYWLHIHILREVIVYFSTLYKRFPARTSNLQIGNASYSSISLALAIKDSTKREFQSMSW